MQGAQLIFATFNSQGSMRIHQSINVDSLLQSESVRYLIDLGKYQPVKLDPYITKFETEQCVAYTLLQAHTDMHGRRSISNKTYIFKYDDVFLDFQKRLPPDFYTLPTEPLSLPLSTVNI